MNCIKIQAKNISFNEGIMEILVDCSIDSEMSMFGVSFWGIYTRNKLFEDSCVKASKTKMKNLLDDLLRINQGQNSNRKN